MDSGNCKKSKKQNLSEQEIQQLSSTYISQNALKNVDADFFANLILANEAIDGSKNDAKNEIDQLKEKIAQLDAQIKELDKLAEKLKVIAAKIDNLLSNIENQFDAKPNTDLKQLIDKFCLEATAIDSIKRLIQPKSNNLILAETAELKMAYKTNNSNTVKKLMDGILKKSNASLNDMNSMNDNQQLMLQSNMERQTKFSVTLSNMMKKMSATSSSLISNLK